MTPLRQSRLLILGLLFLAAAPAARAEETAVYMPPENVGWHPPTANAIDAPNLREALGLSTCANGQVLKVFADGLRCVSAAAETAKGVNCGGNQALQSNGSGLSCYTVR